ncbi:MAG: hypothetical protein CMF46_00035 [Legionellales bacterium]|nr:hypothetical protein [Legionellales bacterium]|tara:strand:+ start:437 stop:1333 length:897 start_codon:yes stop_codon:yes gene_type:complete
MKDNDSPDYHWKTIINDALSLSATDIHVSPTTQAYRIAMRTPRGLTGYQVVTTESAKRLISVIKHRAKMDLSFSRFPQDGQIKGIFGYALSIRVSCVMTVLGQRLVLRLLKDQKTLLPIHRLGMTVEQVKRLIVAAKMTSGLILFCGSTGSGKTTTLFSLLNHMQTYNRSIISLENPIEILIDGIHQIEYDYSSNVELSAWIRGIFRQDPDVIVMGEIRDRNEMNVLIKMALSGHLVCATFHAGSISQAIKRIQAYTAEKHNPESYLRAIVYQEQNHTEHDSSVVFDVRLAPAVCLLM